MYIVGTHRELLTTIRCVSPEDVQSYAITASTTGTSGKPLTYLSKACTSAYCPLWMNTNASFPITFMLAREYNSVIDK